jgi:aerobic carbon-monoxide dehydrogenase small subunit
MYIPAKKTIIKLFVNGEEKQVAVVPNKTLLMIIREELHLTGSKPGCLNGDCGACTLLVDNEPMKSCLMLGVEAIGKEVLTVEGLHDAPIQKTFMEEFAFQCGYCTPGFIMNAHALTSVPNADRELMREWLSSNICRCTSYEEIEQAVIQAMDSIKNREGL